MYQILLVEDDRALALAVQKLLESYGNRVRCVEDFADVLGEFAACQPQLVLMDIKLPYRDGYYWCSRIREISAVPVVFLSSASDNMNIVMALNMGGTTSSPSLWTPWSLRPRYRRCCGGPMRSPGQDRPWNSAGPP